MIRQDELEQLARRLVAGELSVDEFVGQAGRPAIADIGDAQVDLDRRRRCGFPEVVFAEGKTVAAMEKIFEALLQHGAEVLATRMSARAGRRTGAPFPRGPLQRRRPDVPDFALGRRCVLRAGRAGGDCHRRHERPAGGRGSPRNGLVDRGRGRR